MIPKVRVPAARIALVMIAGLALARAGGAAETAKAAAKNPAPPSVSSLPGSRGALPGNWPMPPSELERRLASEDFKIREAKGAGSGVTGAEKLEIEYPDGKTLAVKWKTAPPGKGDGWNNSPRKELAVYEIQRWLFDENDFVVPTVALQCLPMDKLHAIDPAAKPTFAGTSCGLGTLSAWLENVSAPKDAYDEKRFKSDPVYARHIAEVNVLTYLIGHRDSHKGNMLVSTDPADPRVFSVDNGIAFDMLPWNLRVFNWFVVRVPWLPRDTIERLRKVDKARVRSLAVVAQMQADDAGVFHTVARGPDLDPRDDGVARRGNVLQLGLDKDEIDDLQERIDKLLRHVDSGRQPVR